MLSSPAEMCLSHEQDLDSWYAERALGDRARFCRRWPPSNEVLHSPLSDEESELPLIQLRDLCRAYAQTRPRLWRLILGAHDPSWLKSYKKIQIEEKEGLHAGKGSLHVEIGEPIKTAWNAFHPSYRLPDLKWFGTEYAISKAKPRVSTTVGRGFRKIREHYEGHSMDAHEVSRLIG